LKNTFIGCLDVSVYLFVYIFSKLIIYLIA